MLDAVEMEMGRGADPGNRCLVPSLEQRYKKLLSQTVGARKKTVSTKGE
jgi:hypothetical protein